jgi:hypothetical protein
MPGVIELTAHPDKVMTGKAAAEAAKVAAHLAATEAAATAMATTMATTTSLGVGRKHAAGKQGDYQNHRNRFDMVFPSECGGSSRPP